MISREVVIGTIVGMKGASVIVQLADGTELNCGSGAKLHRERGWYFIPVGHAVKVSRDLNTRRSRARIIELIR